LAKISGPLLDRIDMQVEVPHLPPSFLIQTEKHIPEESTSVYERVLKARQRQLSRQGKCNSELTVKELEQYCVLSPTLQLKLMQIMEKFGFSARVYHRLLKLARTIADVESTDLLEKHLGEALQYRFLDRLKLM